MKVLINNQEKDLIPYKGNPQQWWDGENEDNIFSFGELKFPTANQAVTQTVARMSIRTNVRCDVTKVEKPRRKESKKPVRKCKIETLD